MPVSQSTLFNAIVENGKAAAANFPFCTIEPNVGMVTVPDPRLQQLSSISGSKETVRTCQGPCWAQGVGATIHSISIVPVDAVEARNSMSLESTAAASLQMPSVW